MKRRNFFILFISLAFFIFIFNGNVITQPTEEQLKAFRSPKTVRIIVEQSYGEAKGVSLPFESVARRLCEYAGLTVVDANSQDYELTLKIQVECSAIGSWYRGEVHGYHYSAARLSGTILLEKQFFPPYKKSFYLAVDPPQVIYRKMDDPSMAPFRGVFDKYFVPIILKRIREIYGINFCINSLKDKNAFIRNAAANELGEIKDSRAVEPLIAALKDREAGETLAKIGKPAVEPLIAALKDEDWIVRMEAADVLGKIGDARAVEPLTAALKDENASVRDRAVDALGKIKDTRAVEMFITVLKDEAWNVRYKAADVLGKIGDARAVEPLIAALKDKNASVRGKAAEALGKIGDARAVEPLISTLEDKYSYVREAAAEALEKIGKPAVEPLIAALKDDDSYVRRRAAETLGEIADARALEALSAAMKDEAWGVRRQAAKPLGNIGDARAVEPLIAALKDEDKRVLREAVGALAKIGKPAVESLIASLKNKDEHVRKKAAATLKEITGQDFVEDYETWSEWWEENREKFQKNNNLKNNN